MFISDMLNFIRKINIYDLIIFSLLLLSLFGTHTFGFEKTIPQILIAILATSLLDLIIKFLLFKKFLIPKSGIITGLFIGTILEAGIPYFILLVAAIIAILSKHFIKYKRFSNNIFNPAMLSLLFTSYFFNVSLGWWLVVEPISLFILGSLVIFNFKRYDLFFSFIATYFLLFSIFTLGNINFIFNELKNWVIYFFAFFMLTEPKTSPTTTNGRILYGTLVAILILLIRFFSPLPQFALPLGLIIGNLLVPIINLKIS
ncbi:MAG: RnfABCDGE type electron transport complex subunit D [Candidatus Aenigmatarchaeota archaeon]